MYTFCFGIKGGCGLSVAIAAVEIDETTAAFVQAYVVYAWEGLMEQPWARMNNERRHGFWRELQYNGSVLPLWRSVNMRDALWDVIWAARRDAMWPAMWGDR